MSILTNFLKLVKPEKNDYVDVEEHISNNLDKIDEKMENFNLNKLDKGGYTGTAQNLLTEISKIASKTVLGRMIVGKGLTVDSSSGRTSVVSKNDGIIVNDNDIQLNVYDGVDSTSTTRAGSAKAVKQAYDKTTELNDIKIGNRNSLPNFNGTFGDFLKNVKPGIYRISPDNITPLGLDDIYNYGFLEVIYSSAGGITGATLRYYPDRQFNRNYSFVFYEMSKYSNYTFIDNKQLWIKNISQYDIDNDFSGGANKVISSNLGKILNDNFVGNYGRVNLSASSDLTAIKKSGIYKCQGLTKEQFLGYTGLSFYGYGVLLVFQTNSSNVLSQIYIPNKYNNTRGDILMRSMFFDEKENEKWYTLTTSESKIFLGSMGISSIIFIQDAGQKIAGNGYIDMATGKLYLCVNTNNDTSVTSNFVLATNVFNAEKLNKIKDYVIETGSSGLWNWEKYNSGLVHVYGLQEDTSSATTVTLNLPFKLYKLKGNNRIKVFTNDIGPGTFSYGAYVTEDGLQVTIKRPQANTSCYIHIIGNYKEA